MGKSKKRTGGAGSAAERTRLVKVLFNDEERANVGVAAALKNLPVSEFVRTAALEQAAKIIAHHYGRR